MNRSMHIGLRAGERLYVNGAVLRVDRKVSIELLNDVKFLLETHVMQPNETTTPLRQLYFAVQMMLIDAENAKGAQVMFAQLLGSLHRTLENQKILTGLHSASLLVEGDRLFDALKTLRSLFVIEERILQGEDSPVINESRSGAPNAAA